ncbi:MAG: Hsp20/alpha crystallin family protein [Candidatus Colwellbacteria bacterium]|nr:Hsp20/alpha crystallin family protein [Candidatus Colwellbacteria bacterium]
MYNEESLEKITDEGEGQLAVDVYQTPNEIIIESTIAGVKPDDIEVDVTGESVTIRGERHQEDTIDESDYFYRECFWGRFSRSIILPQEVDPEKAHSTLKNGVLTIKLPKIYRGSSRKIKVKAE